MSIQQYQSQNLLFFREQHNVVTNETGNMKYVAKGMGIEMIKGADFLRSPGIYKNYFKSKPFINNTLLSSSKQI